MTLRVPRTDFAYASSSFQHQKPVDDALPWVAAAFAAVPQLFANAGGGKTANTSFVYRSAGVDFAVHVGDTFVVGDAAVLAAPLNFS